MAAEQKSLGERVDGLLSCLTEMETQMDGGMARMEEIRKNEELTQQLKICKASSCKKGIFALNTWLIFTKRKRSSNQLHLYSLQFLMSHESIINRYYLG